MSEEGTRMVFQESTRTHTVSQEDHLEVVTQLGAMHKRVMSFTISVLLLLHQLHVL